MRAGRGTGAFAPRQPRHETSTWNNRNYAEASVRLGDIQGLLAYRVPSGAGGRIVKQKLGPFAPGEAKRWARMH